MFIVYHCLSFNSNVYNVPRWLYSTARGSTLLRQIDTILFIFCCKTLSINQSIIEVTTLNMKHFLSFIITNYFVDKFQIDLTIVYVIKDKLDKTKLLELMEFMFGLLSRELNRLENTNLFRYSGIVPKSSAQKKKLCGGGSVFYGGRDYSLSE